MEDVAEEEADEDGEDFGDEDDDGVFSLEEFFGTEEADEEFDDN
jgi:hypothetical protein